MSGIINSIFQWKRPALYSFSLLVGYAIVCWFVFQNYMDVMSLPFLLGVVTLIMIIKPQRKVIHQYRYCIIAILLLLLSFIIPVKILLYFSVGFALFFLLEAKGYDVGFAGGLVLFIMSPIFQYAANTFSFPIRLQLAQWVGVMMKWISASTSIRENIIYHKNGEFSVDPACMGLNMLVTSLLLGYSLLAYCQRKYDLLFRNWMVFIYTIGIIVLNIISNLFRIFLLVQFSVLPGTIMHDVVGLACMLIYVMLPAGLLLMKYRAQPFLSSRSDTKTLHTATPRYLLHTLLFTMILFATQRVIATDTFKAFEKIENCVVADYKITCFAPGILKLENNTSLVYVKYLRGFYDTDHNPAICWKGSGYELSETKMDAAGEVPVYTSMLVNGTETLYTAWWYSNNVSHTVSQLEWRWAMLQGKGPYAIINVTTNNKNELMQVIKRIKEERLLDPLFKK